MVLLLGQSLLVGGRRRSVEVGLSEAVDLASDVLGGFADPPRAVPPGGSREQDGPAGHE
jgi:hypothetical protein